MGVSASISIDVSPDAQAQGVKSYESDVVEVVIDPLTRLLAKWTINHE